ncbi:type III pantothenate kinase [Spiroplasma turonicum]|uniref:Type III pantothenate kinase n=1 Tax=Spiroplasma turonicum TaxID=216946 RepID=A0A0K1P4Z6_9MOLU|nr:type III pantothenate kinase [Spiroplasma turonicum]AKU79380.1 putative transcriptional regulator [Spiroplasma turonicum]ALX70402.1 type III pantothenate kinase [Spiroplasma turonicum]
MEYLFIDVGNTTVDFRMYNDECNNFKEIMRPLTDDEYYKNCHNLDEYFIKNKLSFTKIIYSSVVPSWTKIIEEYSTFKNIELLNIKNSFKHNLNNFKIDKFDILGADFIANYYGATKYYNFNNAIVVSMGTATTIMVIKENCLLGTVICPGLETALNGLIGKAALLKNYHYEKSSLMIGTNTIDAISIGIFNLHYIMIYNYTNFLMNEYKIKNVIITGGYSQNFVDEINHNGFIYDESLIFKGMLMMINK